MLLGVKSGKIVFLRHLAAGFLAALFVSLFYFLRRKVSYDVLLWKALGDTAFVFLFATLAIGPLARLYPPFLRLISWRREAGIWFAILAFTHFILVNNYALSEPGLALPRLLGYAALFWTMVLAATSSDRAVKFLGISSWKWLHTGAYAIFYLASFHGIYFLFIHYPEKNLFQYLFLSIVFCVPGLQAAAFIKTIIKNRRKIILTQKQVNKRITKMAIIGQKIIAEKTFEISFGLPGAFLFAAGQYVQIKLPKLLYPDPRGSSRVFSINSSPNNQEAISIASRDSGSGFKKTIMELPLGSLVEVDGPGGFFTLPKDEKQPVVFIAGGIGITPFLSMIRFASEEKRSGEIILLYSNRNKESAAYLEELEKIQKINPNFVLKNKFGRLDLEFIKSSVENFDKLDWYIAGPPAMVDTARSILFELGVGSERINIEEFAGYE